MFVHQVTLFGSKNDNRQTSGGLWCSIPYVLTTTLEERTLLSFVSRQKVDEREFNGRVTEVCLNGTFAAVLSGSKVVLQRIELDNQAADGVPGRGRIAPSGVGGSGRVVGAGPHRNFPERNDRDHGEATAVGLTEAFLIYATKDRTLQFFCLSEWAPLAGVELKHESPVKRLWPNYLGTRVAFVDAGSSGWLYSPATDKLTQVKRREGKVWTNIAGDGGSGRGEGRGKGVSFGCKIKGKLISQALLGLLLFTSTFRGYHGELLLFEPPSS